MEKDAGDAEIDRAAHHAKYVDRDLVCCYSLEPALLQDIFSLMMKTGGR